MSPEFQRCGRDRAACKKDVFMEHCECEADGQGGYLPIVASEKAMAMALLAQKI